MASHLQVKAQARAFEVTHLHTKAGFLIVAAIVGAQSIFSPDPTHAWQSTSQIVALLAVFSSLIFAAISMFMEAPHALSPPDMITSMKSHKYYNMDRVTFAQWLAESYSESNEKFNEAYNEKHKQQIWSAALLVVAFAIIMGLKGVELYVK